MVSELASIDLDVMKDRTLGFHLDLAREGIKHLDPEEYYRVKGAMVCGLLERVDGLSSEHVLPFIGDRTRYALSELQSRKVGGYYELANLRAAGALVSRKILRLSFPEIGYMLRKDHKTIMEACAGLEIVIDKYRNLINSSLDTAIPPEYQEDNYRLRVTQNFQPRSILDYYLSNIRGELSALKSTEVSKVKSAIIYKILEAQSEDLTPEGAIELVSRMTNYPVGKIISARRGHSNSIAHLRMGLALFYRKRFNLSFPEIGERLGGKNHATILHSCRKLEGISSDYEVLISKALVNYVPDLNLSREEKPASNIVEYSNPVINKTNRN